jgi:hypothetical protein
MLIESLQGWLAELFWPRITLSAKGCRVWISLGMPIESFANINNKERLSLILAYSLPEGDEHE